MHNLTKYNLSLSFFEQLEERVPKGSTILELGTGEGTKVMVDMGYKVYSIEAHKEWMRFGSNYIHAPLVTHEKIGQWFDHTKFEDKIKDIDYQLLIIDGPRGKEGRANIIHFLDLFDLTKHIVIDDVEREGERKIYEAVHEKTQRKEQQYTENGKQFIWIDSA